MRSTFSAVRVSGDDDCGAAVPRTTHYAGNRDCSARGVRTGDEPSWGWTYPFWGGLGGTSGQELGRHVYFLGSEALYYGDHGQNPNHQIAVSASAVMNNKIKLLTAAVSMQLTFDRGVS